jgi:hypothetical protein
MNKDHYPTKSIKLTYIEGRIKGEATTYISPRLRDDALNPYNTI